MRYTIRDRSSLVSRGYARQQGLLHREAMVRCPFDLQPVASPTHPFFFAATAPSFHLPFAIASTDNMHTSKVSTTRNEITTTSA